MPESDNPTGSNTNLVTAPADGRASKRWRATNGCRVSVSITVPDTSKYLMAPSVLDLLGKVLDGRYPKMVQGRTSVTIAFVASAAAPTRALGEVFDVLPELTNVLGVDSDAAFDVRLASSEELYPRSQAVDEAAAQPGGGYDEILGVGEAADLLGVTKQRVHQLARSDDFPEPMTRLKATPVWKRSDVESYAARRNTKSGPALSLVGRG